MQCCTKIKVSKIKTLQNSSNFILRAADSLQLYDELLFLVSPIALNPLWTHTHGMEKHYNCSCNPSNINGEICSLFVRMLRFSVQFYYWFKKN